MAGLIAALFGGKNAPNTDPLPGIGGYDMPRGPYGEGGFPGSTSAAPPTHPQSPEGSRQRYQTASQAQDEWNNLPTRHRNGTPRGPRVRNMAQANDTEVRSTPILSQNVPGNQNQRNTKYYGGRLAAPNGINRYVFDGENGGFESYAVQRRIPYRIHDRPAGYDGAPSNRGADLSGQRYTMAPSQNLNRGGHGSYGVGRERGPNHRPVKFTQPGPWSANYYDEAPDQGTQAPNMVHRSGTSAKSKTAKKAKTKPESRPNEIEHRTSPHSRGRVTSAKRKTVHRG